MASTEAKTEDPRPAVLGDLRMKQNPMIVDPVGPITGGAGSVHTRETAEKRTSIVAHPYLRLWCGTWNVGNAQPPDDLRPWIPASGEGFDVFVVGAQEATYKQKHAYPYHPGPASDEVVDGTVDATAVEGEESKTPEEVSNLPFFNVVARHVGGDFVCVASLAIWCIGLAVFVRSHLVSEVTDIVVKSEATGFMGVTPNKGGIVAAMNLGGKRVCFVSSHLAAHLDKVDARNANYCEIVENVRISKVKNVDLDCGFDHLFWLGDLNYRCDMRLKFVKTPDVFDHPIIPTPGAFTNLKSFAEGEQYSKLMDLDQLKAVQKHGKAFVGFEEGTYGFPPTFKVRRVVGTTYNEEREPSYCDRVLWKSLPTLISHVECQGVAGHPSIPTSDHKPVSAHFRLYCPPPVTAIEYGHTSQLPRIVFSELRGSQLFAADIHTSDPYIEFYADADGVLVTSSKGVPRTPVKSNTLNPSWGDDEIPPLYLACRDVHSASRLNITFLVMDKDVNQDDRMGQAVLGLAYAAKAQTAVPFDLIVTHNGDLGRGGSMLVPDATRGSKCCVIA